MMRYQLYIASANHTLVSIDDFQIAPQEITVLFGESGIGKTLISQAIFGLLDPFELEISINGKPYNNYVRSKEVQKLQTYGFFVFQEPSTHLNPLMTLQEQLNEGKLAKTNRQKEILQALWRQPYETHVRPLLQIYPKPFRPSGGEKQRFLLAMAFKKLMLPANGAQRLFIFDEPTGSLDNVYRDIFLNELFNLYTRNPFTILLITHDYSMISTFEKQHTALLSRIHLKELRRINGAQVRLFDFKAEDYTGWLKAQSPAPLAKKGQPQETVLKMEPTFRVFGKTFHLTREPDRGKTVPLIIHKKELIYLKAPSGMGKTTLAKIIAGLQQAEAVHFELSGIRFDQDAEQKVWRKYVWGKKLAMVFQHADESLNLQANVRDVFKGLPGVNLQDDVSILNALQEMFDQQLEPKFLTQKVAHLSGGQKQRLNLLRALLLHPDLIILDEPLNGLDFISIRKVLDIIRRKMAAGSGILLVSHNEEIFDRIVPKQCWYYLNSEE